MHGEFKVPGGKLVVVDLEVVDGRISDFRLAGDFFLEPDSALEAIVYREARHEIFNETNRDEVIADLVGWLDARLRG